MLGESSWHARGKRGREKEGVLVSSRMRRGKVRRGREEERCREDEKGSVAHADAEGDEEAPEKGR
jgi:hypothetical protein